MPHELKLLLFIVIIFEVAYCALKIFALFINLGWFIQHGQEYRRRLDQIRNEARRETSPTGVFEVHEILTSMGAGTTLGVGINEIGLRRELQLARWNPTHYNKLKVALWRALLFLFDFPSIALIGGFTLIFIVQSVDRSSAPLSIVTFGGALVTLLTLAMAVLNIEATVYHACIGRYAHSFLNTGPT